MDRKKLISLLIIVLSSYHVVYSQTSSKNYVVKETILDEKGLNSVKSVQYYDGIGRPNMLVCNGKNTSGKYLYTHTEYDGKGQPIKTWLPAVGNNTPDYVSSIESWALSTYDGDDAYVEKTFDPLGRVVFEGIPGKAWKQNNKGTQTISITNKTKSVKKYRIDKNGNPIDSPVEYYSAGTLTGEKTIDADGNSVEVYKDICGHVVLERRNGDNDTYYVYDRGLLRVVIPPLYQNERERSISMLYKYKYDTHGRCIEETLPGCLPIAYYYDKCGRVAFMQDARMRNNDIYRFYMYDGLNRLVVQGLCKDTINSLSRKMMTVTFMSGKYDVANTGYYFVNDDRVVDAEIEVVNYYDGYDFLKHPAFADIVSKNRLKQNTSVCTTTLQTARIVSTTNKERIYEVMYYDKKGRCTESIEYLPNNTSVHTITEFSFTNKPLSVTSEYWINGEKFHTLTNTFNYDSSSDLLLSHSLQFDNNPSVVLSENMYDDLGHIACINNGSKGKMHETFHYDVHGWLRHHDYINSNDIAFLEHLQYEDGKNRCFNGNISSVVYHNSNEKNKICGYNYLYDNLNRLVSCVYMEGVDLDKVPVVDYSERFTYDENSSIKSLVRYGKANGNYTSVIDSLTYRYVENENHNNIYELTAIDDNATNIPIYGSFEFKDVKGAFDYAYDDCGALITDKNKGIICIEYNANGMPVRIQFENGNVTEYVYSSLGVKQKVIHRTAVPGLKVSSAHILTSAETANVDSTLYLGPFEIQNNQEDAKYYFENGYLKCGKSSDYSLIFFAKDYLGNVRAIFNSEGKKLQEYNYYAFGGLMNDNFYEMDYQTHKYNGKELDRMHGLDWYDYGARYYDAAVGGFISPDPLRKKYYNINSYLYCAANPIKYIDPDGKKVELVVRQLNSWIPSALGVHTFIIVTSEGKKPESFTYGPRGTFFGTLERTSYEDDDNIREGKDVDVNYERIEVPTPAGLTEEEFDQKVKDAAKQFEGNTEINYNILTNSEVTGNCNTSSTTLLLNAGVSPKVIQHIKKQIKGNAYGFGERRPWTKKERQKAKERN